MLQELADGGRFGAPIRLAIFHAMAGDAHAGAEWLEKAGKREPRVLVFLSLAPGKVWRASAHWPALANMMNLPAGVA